jgi:hypothetical protein
VTITNWGLAEVQKVKAGGAAGPSPADRAKKAAAEARALADVLTELADGRAGAKDDAVRKLKALKELVEKL